MAGASLEHLPIDVLVSVTQLLSILDILTLEQVSF
jgi:hypothetical protein